VLGGSASFALFRLIRLAPEAGATKKTAASQKWMAKAPMLLGVGRVNIWRHVSSAYLCAWLNPSG